jgi:hypothetical protein
LTWRSIRWALILETVVMVAWSLAAGLAADEDPRRPPLLPMLLVLIPLAAGLRESLRRSRTVPKVLEGMGTPMLAAFLTGALQFLLLIPLGIIDEQAVDYAIPAVVSMTVVGFTGVIAYLLSGMAVAFYRHAPLGSSMLRRWLGPLGAMFLFMCVFGVVFGSSAPGGGRRGAFLIRLLFAEPTFPYLLWVGRAGVLGLLVVAIIALVAILRRKRADASHPTEKSSSPDVPGPSASSGAAGTSRTGS